MICPFLLIKEKKKIPIYDEEGYKVGDRVEERWSTSPCIKEECEFYDVETGRCIVVALFHILKDIPEVLHKKLDQSLYDKAEMLSVVLSSGLQHMEESLKQSNEVMKESIGRQEVLLNSILSILTSIKSHLEEQEKEEEDFYTSA